MAEMRSRMYSIAANEDAFRYTMQASSYSRENASPNAEVGAN